MAFSNAASGQQFIKGQNWTLVNLPGVDLGGADAHIDFDAAGRRFTGNTSCNIMNGSVRLGRGNTISFNAIITTKRACVRTTAAVESGLLAALAKTDRYQASSNRLKLYSGKTLLAEFSPRLIDNETGEHQPVADKYTLQDRKWLLEAISGKAIPAVQQQAFIVFDPAKGGAGGDTSCNVFGGNYTTNGQKFKFSQGISTMRACIEDARMQIERDFLEGLRVVDRFEIIADKLYLYRGTKELLSFQGIEK
jgi:heat shock protein HslJ